MAGTSSWITSNLLRFFDGALSLLDIDFTSKWVKLYSHIRPVTGAVNTGVAGSTLDASQSGQTFVGVVDALFTLPLVTAALAGVRYTFVCGVASAGTGLQISPNAADFISGNGLTAVVNKDLINAGATDRIGDAATIYCDGVGWWIEAVLGTWSKEP